jgi:elongation factor Ts
MANYTAQDVKRLREETDAPMMECKAALDEADGDFEKAKQILREKGKAAAGKRAGRATSAGVVAISAAQDHHTVGAIVLESETDFVARNEDFINLAQELAEIFLHNDPGSDPLTVKHGDKTVGDMVEAAVATIRENIRLAKAVRVTSENQLCTYVHHDRTKGAIVEMTGDPAVREVGRSLAIQVVAFPPEVVSKDQLSQEMLDREIEIETQRAIGEGKPENIAKNIAQGRVNKEYVNKAVLLEQPFYVDPSKSVKQYVAEHAPGSTVVGFTYLGVGSA